MIPENLVIEAWCMAVQQFYSLCRAERLAELNERGPRLLDDRGLHPRSVEVGRVMALQDIYPLLEQMEFQHLTLRRVAKHDAVEQFEHETALRVGVEQGWITESEAAVMRSHYQRYSAPAVTRR